VILNGNAMVTAAISEMLLQSQLNGIDLLPALPHVWQEGSAQGLRARGGFEVNIEWEAGCLQRAQIKSLLGRRARVRSKTAIEVTSGGKSINTKIGEEWVEFDTTPGSIYQIGPAGGPVHTVGT